MKFSFSKEIKGEESDIKKIFFKIKNRDFSGTSGLILKNSIYQIGANIIAKIGSLLFTIIIARLLMPELFGLYNLVIATLLIFVSLSELGIGNTLIRFVSRELGKNNQNKAQAYIFYLAKINLFLIAASVLVLIVSAKFIAANYYNKEIFIALIFGVFYIVTITMNDFLQFLLQSSNYFKGIFQKEIIFQISRLVIIPIIIVFALKNYLSQDVTIAYIVVGLSAAFFIASLFIVYLLTKKLKFNKKRSKLTKKQVKQAKSFLFATTTFILSGVFFGYIDRIMLGRFVSPEFIGFYSAAFSLIGALVTLGTFGVVLLPFFSRLKETELARWLKKSLKFTFIFSLCLLIVTLILSKTAVLIVYGSEYFPAINILRILSFLLITIPLASVYSSYFMSKGEPGKVTKVLVLSTIVNIVLNYFFITTFLKYGEISAVYGASLATIISQGIYLMGLFFLKR